MVSGISSACSSMIMKLETKAFIEFVEYLTAENILADYEVIEALSFVDGMEGVISDDLPILGYKGLGFYINRKLSFDSLKKFVSQNIEMLKQHSGERYFFVHSLLDSPKFSETERISLIDLMPKVYRSFLQKSFTSSDSQKP